MLECFARLQKKTKSIAYITAGIGVGIWISGFFMVDIIMIMAIIGVILITIGTCIHTISWVLKLQCKEDAKLETQVRWKKIGRMNAINAVEEFLKLNDEKYIKKKVRWSAPQITTKPAYKYVFENGNYIYILYHKYETGFVLGRVAVGYTYPNYAHAKNLQSDLDEFLGMRDLIERF